MTPDEMKEYFGKFAEELTKDKCGLNDSVDKPFHYNQGDIECIDAMTIVFGEEDLRTYAKVSVFKYIWRHRYKAAPEEDLKKARFYLDLALGVDPRK